MHFISSHLVLFLSSEIIKLCAYIVMEVNMRSKIEENSELGGLRKKKHVRVIENKLTGLRVLGQKLIPIQRRAFRKRYGNLLGLLEVEVQIPVVTALAQYYDPPLRCFTFQDFQLVPTLEEFEQILDVALEGGVPYKHLEQHAFIPTLAGIMKIHPRELEGKFVTRKDTKGFTQRYLETYLYQLADKGDWETFTDVLALVFYGVLIFPNHEDFVGYNVIDVFVAVKTRAENPIPVILADTYTTLDSCHESRNRKMLCCIPALYVWLASCIGEKTIGVKCPVELVARRGP